jgi:predicted Zn-dependent protease
MSIFGGGYNQGGGGRRFNPRWIIAGVIAIIGIVSYIGTRQRNPVTGEMQHVAMSVEQERALGLQAAPQMAQQMGGAVDPKRDPDAQLVADVGNKIVRASEAGRSPYADNFHFYLLDDRNTVNAFALPGGQIFITRALFDRLENEAQLAGVLGHEIGHVIHRHSAQQMAKGQLGQMLATAAGVGSDDSRIAMGAQMANQMIQLKYGRGDESQSDSTGVDYMATAGYDPREMLGVMQILKKASGGGRQPEFLSSHPLPETRLQELETIINQRFKPADLQRLSKGQSLHGGAPSGGGGRPPAKSEKW